MDLEDTNVVLHLFKKKQNKTNKDQLCQKDQSEQNR